MKELLLESGKTSSMLSLAWPKTKEKVTNRLLWRPLSPSVQSMLLTNFLGESMSSVLARSEGFLLVTSDELVLDLVGPVSLVGGSWRVQLLESSWEMAVR